MSILITALILSFSLIQNDAAKILAVFPLASISHQVVFRPLTQELARRGHDVTVITPDPAFPKGGTPPNLTEIDVHDISYKKWEELYKITSSGKSDLLTQMRGAFFMINDIFEMQLKVKEVQNLIKNEKFDLLFLEACARPALVLTHAFDAPVILISSFGPLTFNIETIGASWHPLLYPNNLRQRLYNLTNWEKIVELWNFYRLHTLMLEVEAAENEMAKRMFGPNVPTISELKNNVDMMFLNIHPVWEGNRPVPPSVIFMGGLHQKPVKELPKVCYIICFVFPFSGLPLSFTMTTDKYLDIFIIAFNLLTCYRQRKNL